ncbi:CidA/LrgA family holin-like protein [Paenibacillus sp. HJL G12]|uniref:CidA/LrgA family holin-like protein n=1 Tax=Paenibacillus dendrobii TaxID=2691084 RepID=A0A7X3LKB5_9BACL|nr:CidA/LrgA family holin-like protein [Paenibacillus dendrobii]MWV46309.1 CidA/LrgA family holin-like protein [Paenibacillus dendrobii]
MKSLFKIVLQVLFFILIAQFSDMLVLWLHLPVPGSIVGIIILYALLKLKVIRLDWIELGSQWLLSEMLLFFIPATVSIINYKTLIMNSGLQVLATIAGSTIVVMLCAGLIGQRISKGKESDAA